MNYTNKSSSQVSKQRDLPKRNDAARTRTDERINRSSAPAHRINAAIYLPHTIHNSKHNCGWFKTTLTKDTCGPMLLSTIEYEILTRFTASQRDGDPECDVFSNNFSSETRSNPRSTNLPYEFQTIFLKRCSLTLFKGVLQSVTCLSHTLRENAEVLESSDISANFVLIHKSTEITRS